MSGLNSINGIGKKNQIQELSKVNKKFQPAQAKKSEKAGQAVKGDSVQFSKDINESGGSKPANLEALQGLTGKAPAQPKPGLKEGMPAAGTIGPKGVQSGFEKGMQPAGFFSSRNM